jgi:hypothetical protein
MTTQEILDYFSGSVVYLFNGNLSELQQLQEENSNSYNYVVSGGNIYYVAQKTVDDPRVSILQGV